MAPCGPVTEPFGCIAAQLLSSSGANASGPRVPALHGAGSALATTVSADRCFVGAERLGCQPRGGNSCCPFRAWHELLYCIARGQRPPPPADCLHPSPRGTLGLGTVLIVGGD